MLKSESFNNNNHLFFKVKESGDQQAEEACAKSESCEQVCTSCKCRLRDIEDCIISTDAEKVTEKDDDGNITEPEVTSEILTDIENEQQKEEDSKGIVQEELENITTNEVSLVKYIY